jgi:serine/threonine protein kinase
MFDVGEAVAEVGSTANSYQILARLATGGMAEIFLARGVSTTGVERYCVLKRILRNRATDVSFVRMFLDEARLAAQLQHPHVAQLYDVGKLGDSYFFTMEYVHGETVRSIAQRALSLRRELPLGVVLTIVAGAAAGLHHAHERIGVDGRPLAIVHRDVSPSNLMVSYEGTVKVVDFGVAKANDRANETRSGTVKGKISYLSPEQARGSPAIDRRSDLFSLGIVLWELLVLERLYKRGSDFENMSAIVNEPPVAPSTKRAGIPLELDAIALRLLAKDPHDRFETADDLVDALEGVSARSGALISPSALARFLKEMFGQRPEPWVELETAEKEVTVTSDAGVELDFANLPRVTLESPVPLDEHAPTPLIVTSPEDIPTVPQPVVDPRTTLMGHTAVAARVGGSGPQPRIAEPVYPIAGARAPVVEAPRAGRGITWPLVAVVAVAAIIGSVAMILVMRRDGGTRAAANAGVGDAAIVVQAPSTADDATVVTQAAIARDAAIVVQAPSMAVDAAHIEQASTTVDAPVVVQSSAVAADAAPVAATRDVAPAEDAAIDPDIEIEKPKRPPPDAAVIAACKVGNIAKARALLAKLERSKRKPAIAACKNVGVALDEVNKCETDPMSCQH